MSFDERRAAYGFPPTNPAFYAQNNSMSYKIAAGCVVFIVAGFCVHYTIAKMMYEKHNREMLKRTKEFNEHLRQTRERAKRFSDDPKGAWREIMQRGDKDEGGGGTKS